MQESSLVSASSGPITVNTHDNPIAAGGNTASGTPPSVGVRSVSVPLPVADNFTSPGAVRSAMSAVDTNTENSVSFLRGLEAPLGSSQGLIATSSATSSVVDTDAPVEPSLVCSLSGDIFVNPYIAPNGQTYSYDAVIVYLNTHQNRLPGYSRPVDPTELIENRAVQKKLEEYVKSEAEYDDSSYMECPITMERFKTPVVASDGNTYEFESIREWLNGHSTSPLTGLELPNVHALYPNLNLIKGGALASHPAAEVVEVAPGLNAQRTSPLRVDSQRTNRLRVAKLSTALGFPAGVASFICVGSLAGFSGISAVMAAVSSGAVAYFLVTRLVSAVGNGLIAVLSSAEDDPVGVSPGLEGADSQV